MTCPTHHAPLAAANLPGNTDATLDEHVQASNDVALPADYTPVLDHREPQAVAMVAPAGSSFADRDRKYAKGPLNMGDLKNLVRLIGFDLKDHGSALIRLMADPPAEAIPLMADRPGCVLLYRSPDVEKIAQRLTAVALRVDELEKEDAVAKKATPDAQPDGSPHRTSFLLSPGSLDFPASPRTLTELEAELDAARSTVDALGPDVPVEDRQVAVARAERLKRRWEDEVRSVGIVVVPKPGGWCMCYRWDRETRRIVGEAGAMGDMTPWDGRGA